MKKINIECLPKHLVAQIDKFQKRGSKNRHFFLLDNSVRCVDFTIIEQWLALHPTAIKIV